MELRFFSFQKFNDKKFIYKQKKKLYIIHWFNGRSLK